MATEPSDQKRIHVELTVLESQREELHLPGREIVAGKRPRMGALNLEISAITVRAMNALRIIEDALRRNPTTGQARRLVWFLAAVYNGPEYLFDLSELRALDYELANACLDYLNHDRLGWREVHRHLSSGDAELQQWIQDYGLRPRPYSDGLTGHSERNGAGRRYPVYAADGHLSESGAFGARRMRAIDVDRPFTAASSTISSSGSASWPPVAWGGRRTGRGRSASGILLPSTPALYE
jgi:hypothetical protein